MEKHNRPTRSVCAHRACHVMECGEQQPIFRKRGWALKISRTGAAGQAVCVRLSQAMAEMLAVMCPITNCEIPGSGAPAEAAVASDQNILVPNPESPYCCAPTFSPKSKCLPSPPPDGAHVTAQISPHLKNLSSAQSACLWRFDLAPVCPAPMRVL